MSACLLSAICVYECICLCVCVSVLIRVRPCLHEAQPSSVQKCCQKVNVIFPRAFEVGRVILITS